MLLKPFLKFTKRFSRFGERLFSSLQFTSTDASQNPRQGYISQKLWFQKNPGSTPEGLSRLFDHIALTLHANVIRLDSDNHFNVDGLSSEECKAVQNLLLKNVSSSPHIDSRILDALKLLGITQLTTLQAYLFALLQYNFSISLKTNLIVHGAPFMDAMIASVLPLLNHTATVYPSRAMDLLKRYHFQVQCPSTLFLFSHFHQVLACQQELRRLSHELFYSTYVAGADAVEMCKSYKYGFQCLLGTPNMIGEMLLAGVISLEACDHVVVHGIDMMGKRFLSDVERLTTHPHHGLHSNLSRSSSLLFSCERTADSPRARHLAQILAPPNSATPKLTRDCAKLVKLDVTQVLPTEGVKYGVFKFSSNEERIQRFGELVRELQYLKQRVLIVWSLDADHELWRRCGLTNCVFRIQRQEQFEEYCREFNDGRTPILLLHSNVVKFGIAAMPSQLDVLIHVDYSEDIVTEDTRLHRLLHPGTGVSLTLLLESDLNTSRVSTWARLMKRSALPVPNFLAHLLVDSHTSEQKDS